MSGDIVTDRLVLRDLRPDDAEAMFAYRSDPEIMRYQGWDPESLDDARAFIAGNALYEPFAPGSWRQFAITLRSDGAMIGDCGVHVPDDKPEQAEFGITLATAYQRRGYASEALRALLRLVFDTLGKHRAFASVDPRNAPSIALFERAGFRKEAHHVESLWLMGEWVDDVIFAMLAREWRAYVAAPP
ncbi:MAG TPA: GNAT family N-acetyltransferase [Xanthomonadales bacterium]|nr:GNAT family N-acetyltransferase [Xanthomonadales bacterium]